MRRFALIAAILFFHSQLLANFQIGSFSVTYQDPDRSNRNIPVDIYYPATQNGQNAPLAPGIHPVVIFAHGFAMNVNAYQNIWEALVPKGYVIVLPKTEGSLFPAPSHSNFGLDISFLASHMQSIANVPGSFFYQQLSDRTAIMGHSMGGGSSFLAAAGQNPYITTKVTLAAAETNPSAIAAAENIQIPSLMIAGANDCVTPPPDHQIPMYQALAASCKHYVSIIGASHCRFAESNFNCNFGESTCSPSAAISRQQQQEYMNQVMIPWLDYHLKGDCKAWLQFDSITQHAGFLTHESNCNIVLPDAEITSNGDLEFCNGESVLLSAMQGDYTYQWSNGETQPEIIVDESAQINLILTDQAGCSDTSAFIQVEVFDLPEPEIIISTDFDICNGDSLTLELNQTFDKVLWNDVIEAGSLTIFEAQSVSVSVTDTNGCSVVTNPEVFEPFLLPDQPEIFSSGDTLFSSLEGDTYTWFFDDQFYDETTSTFLIPVLYGTYTLTVKLNNGCEVTSEAFEFLFSHTNQQIEQQQPELFFSADAIYVKTSTFFNNEFMLKIYTTDGRLIATKTLRSLNAGKTRLYGIQSLPEGLYYVQFINSAGFKQVISVIR